MVAWKRVKDPEFQVGIHKVIDGIGVAHLFCSYELILCEDNKRKIHERFRDPLRQKKLNASTFSFAIAVILLHVIKTE